MKKLIFNLYFLNISIGIILFFIYRIIIFGIEAKSDKWHDELVNFIDILFNLYMAFIFLVLAIISSLSVLLNLIVTIRNNYYFSLLSFIGIPIVFIGYFAVIFIIDFNENEVNIFTTLLLLSIIYLFFTVTEFLFFRKKLKSIS